jgi:cytochrome c oxidase subunit 2
MIEIVIGIAVVLILVILLLIFRLNTLVGVMRGSYSKTAGFSNKVNAVMLLIFFIVGVFLFFWYSSVASHHYLPKAVSDHGIRTDLMFWITMSILCFAFIVTNIFLFYFAFKYQHSDDRKAYFYPDNHKLEIIWTVIPAIVMAILVFYGWQEWSAITRPEPPDSEVVEVMGKQFAWQVRYPGKDKELGKYSFKLIDPSNEFGIDFSDKYSFDDFIPSEIHIPKGHPVLFRIRARDVIHSVFAPHFRLKMDAVPGMPTKFWFTPNKTTQEIRDELGNPEFNYELACTEVCGRGHFAMRFIIVVDEPEDYEKWYASQKTFSELNKEYVASKSPENLKYLLGPLTDSTATPAQKVNLPADTLSRDTTKNSNLHALRN